MKALLLTSLSNKYVKLIMNCKTAKARDRLNMFHGHGDLAKVANWKEYYDFRMASKEKRVKTTWKATGQASTRSEFLSAT